MKSPYLSVIVPAYNEEHRIVATLDAIYAYLEKQAYTWELLIVLDGSTDRTIDRIRSFAAEKTSVRWLDRAENRGKGYTVRQGMLAAEGQVRLFTDADNSTPLHHFDHMVPWLEQGRQVVIGTRDAKDARGAVQVVPQPILKRFLGNVGNIVIQLLAVPGIWDTQCGFKAFTAEAAERIFSVARIDRWGFDIEALALARHFGYQIAVIPTTWVDQPETHVRWSDYLQTFGDAFRVRWLLLSGAYKSGQSRAGASRS